MSGVDILDQKLRYYMYLHKSQKWYHTLFHRATEVELVANGYVVYWPSNTQDSVMSAKRFRESVTDGLLDNYAAPDVKVGRTPTTQTCCQTLCVTH